MTHLRIQPMLNNKIKATQSSDLQIQKIIEKVKKGLKIDLAIKGNDSLWYSKRLCVPNDLELKREIMEEVHKTSYSIHIRSTKM